MSGVDLESGKIPSSESDFKPGILKQDFFNRSTQMVARELLGKKLVRIIENQKICGIITETEAYIGENDLGCHARAGRTNRTNVMYGPPGHAYVYFTYGVHWMLNVVTENVDFPAAVLIRAVKPVEGLEIINQKRPAGDTNGPAKLTQAFAINGELNGVILTNRDAGLWIENGVPLPPREIIISPRVGLNSVPEPWKSMPWRFRIDPYRFENTRK
jgi:DNA-3-methyladenine glycosylase